MSEPQCVRSWSQFLSFGILLEEYELPPFWEQRNHQHERGHGWLLVDGGFEEETPSGVRWRGPGSVESHHGGFARAIRCGDRGGQCLVFESVAPVRGSRGGVAVRSAAERLAASLESGGSAADGLHALTTYLGLALEHRSEPRWISEIDALLRAHYREPLRTGEIARQLRKHRVHVSREYRRFRGRTIADQVKMLRLLDAPMLLSGGHSISTIASELGFADQSHFTREFRSRYGMSPRRFVVAFVQDPLAAAS